MSATRNDTTTVLNPGAAGDAMDESLVTQSDGTTQAKRPRVVPGGDDGSLQGFDHDGVRNRAAVVDHQAVGLLQEVLLEMRRQTGLLQVLVQQFEPNLVAEEVNVFTEDL